MGLYMERGLQMVYIARKLNCPIFGGCYFKRWGSRGDHRQLPAGAGLVYIHSIIPRCLTSQIAYHDLVSVDHTFLSA